MKYITKISASVQKCTCTACFNRTYGKYLLSDKFRRAKPFNQCQTVNYIIHVSKLQNIHVALGYVQLTQYSYTVRNQMLFLLQSHVTNVNNYNTEPNTVHSSCVVH